MTVANALQLEGRTMSRQSFEAVSDHFSCYLPASNQTSDIAVRFSDPDFLKRSNNLATRRRFSAVGQVIDDLAHFRRRYVTV